MNARVNFCALAGCVGGMVLFVFGHADAALFSVQVPMPTRLSVQRSGNSLSVSFDLASLRNLKVSAGQKMTLGLKYELRVYAKGDTRPVDASVGYASINEPVTPAGLGFLKSAQILNRVQGGIPAPGKRYIVEEDLSLFETDVPPQHMWNPQAGKTYTVLWKKTLKSVS